MVVLAQHPATPKQKQRNSIHVFIIKHLAFNGMIDDVLFNLSRAKLAMKQAHYLEERLVTVDQKWLHQVELIGIIFISGNLKPEGYGTENWVWY